jgi:P4 family phage/plasmid primase-like protien
MLEHAIARALEGWRVFPLAPGSKTRPLIRDWPNRATTDVDLIREWWFEWPHANIGGLCGEDWLVIDIDIRDEKRGAESLERLQADYDDLIPTREHSTPSGGWHYVYRKPSNWGTSDHKIQDFAGYDNIDVQVGGAYVVLPPSRTDEGAYTVRNNRQPVEGPLWLVQARNGAVGKGAHSPKAAIANLGQVMHKRDNQLYRMASLLRREGHSFEYVVEQLTTAAASPLAYPMHGPKPEHDINRIVKSAFRHPADLFSDSSAVVNNDLNNGWLIAAIAGGELLWNDRRGAWYEWTGNRWKMSGYRLRLLTGEAIEALWSAWHLSDSESEAKAISKRVDTLSTWTTLRGAWEFLKGEVWVENEDFDADRYLLNCPNGTVDLTTGLLREHRPLDRITHVTRTDYDPSADMSEWEEFVLWCGKGDVEWARWLQIALGQAMIGKVDENIMAFLFGGGANGKSAMMSAILATIGDYGYEAPVELIVSRGVGGGIHDEYLVALEGRRLVVCPEPARGTHWNDGRLKAITGGDGIPCRPNYGKPMIVTPKFLLVVHGNNRPEVRDRSDGFNRRMRLVPFDNRVPDAVRNTGMAEVLAGPGVLRWLVEGARQYLESRFLPVSARIEGGTKQYLRESNQLGRFIEECLAVGPGLWSASSDIYAVYRSWCHANGERFMETSQALFEQLRLALQHGDGGSVVKAHTRERGGMRQRGWDGVEITWVTTTEVPI